MHALLIVDDQMRAELQLPSPLVPTRTIEFVRYCKLHPDGTWAVVDASISDDINPGSGTCHKRPSGCLIQELPEGHSKVIKLYMHEQQSYLR